MDDADDDRAPGREDRGTGKLLRMPPRRRAISGDDMAALVRHRLRDPRWQDRLADALVAAALERPVRALVDPALLAEGIRDALLEAGRSPAFDARFALAVSDVLAFLDAHGGPVGTLLPGELRDGLRELARRPGAPAPELVLELLGHPPVRRAIRDLVVEILRGLGPVAAEPSPRRPRGALARRARESMQAGSFGRLALGVAGAVSDEVERSMERRTREAVDGAMTMVLGKIASHLGRGRGPREREALQVGLLDAALGLPGKMVRREIEAIDPAEGQRVVSRSLCRWLEDEEASRQGLTQLFEALLAREGEQTLGQVLDGLELRQPVTAMGAAILRREIAAMVPGAPVAAFLDALFDPEVPD